ncbi:carbohydrate ABC transporter permease [Cryptosporangium minutisporangium]|uniref:Carbohydrate ABC transporter permease n=1 Tax=Cryptosporangium minutisporangium TaxID=113569 RepID=A0ABP6T3R4_9ACTN
MRTLVSASVLTRPKGRAIYWTVFGGTVLAFVVAFLFPVYWMVVGAMKSSDELVRTPPTLVPEEWHPENYKDAWGTLDLTTHLTNTAVQAAGAWILQLVFCTLAAYALSRLRPVFGQVILGGILATLMVPASALLVPKYLTIVDVPIIHVNLLNSPLAIWLPAVANAFNLYLLKRFFDQIPSELLEAAEIDGAGPVRRLWHVVLPLSRPVLGVVSIFAVVAVWQDFLWPLLVFSDTSKSPISVALVQLSADAPASQLIAAMVIASLPMIALFLVFQRHIIAGIGAGSLKG